MKKAAMRFARDYRATFLCVQNRMELDQSRDAAWDFIA